MVVGGDRRGVKSYLFIKPTSVLNLDFNFKIKLLFNFYYSWWSVLVFDQ